nr:TRAP transporter small permease [uncultured Oscillibacter sp.]
MKILKRINSALIAISKFLCLLGGVMLIAMMLITAVDVGLRTFVHSTFSGASVVVRNMLVVAMFLGLPYVTFVAGHTRSEFLYARASSRVQLILDTIAEGIGTVLFLLMAYAMIKPTLQSFATSQFDSEGTFLMPMGPFYVLALFGAWFTFYAAAYNFVKLIFQAVKKEDEAK